jgi:hypothetical protein
MYFVSYWRVCLKTPLKCGSPTQWQAALISLSQLPFFAVKISCVVHAARYPELLEFHGWLPAFEVIVDHEGLSGLFRVSTASAMLNTLNVNYTKAFSLNMIIGLVESWRILKDLVARAMDEPPVTRRSGNNLIVTKQNSKGAHQ